MAFVPFAYGIPVPAGFGLPFATPVPFRGPGLAAPVPFPTAFPFSYPVPAVAAQFAPLPLRAAIPAGVPFAAPVGLPAGIPVGFPVSGPVPVGFPFAGVPLPFAAPQFLGLRLPIPVFD